MARVTERELKFEAGHDVALPELTALVPGGRVAARPAKRLETTYFDTADLRLARWGVTLRHRVEDGDGPVWTVKLRGEGATSDGLRTREELSFPASPDAIGAVPDDVAALVRAYARHEPLAPVVRMVTRRGRFVLEDAAGLPVAEVDDDEVVASRRRRVLARFREIEVELDPAVDETTARDLAREVGRILRKAGAGPARQANKLLRALAPETPALLPEVADDDLGRRPTAGDLVRAAIAAGTRRLMTHDPAVRLDDVEGVHQMRVATRRLRSDPDISAR